VDVEIWSDIACPWCFIGKRRFEAALERFEHRDEVTVTWRAFELDPDAPAVREEDAATLLARKYGTSREQVLASQRQLTELAAAEGLRYRLAEARIGNTFDAHRLAKAGGPELVERLFSAQHEQGRALGDHATLRELAPELADVLASDAHADEVREDEALARAIGITAVPFFVIDRRFGTAGAQPSELLLEGLRQGWERAQLQGDDGAEHQ
jgi:predicted DsbA family dithiol-disulfide isomerase